MYRMFIKNVVLLILLIISNVCIVRAQEINEVIEPIDVIDVFYSDLLSNKPYDECADIFIHPESIVSAIEKNEFQGAPQKLNATGNLWYYFRKHKDVFLFPDIPSEQIGKKGGITYMFSVSGRRQFFVDGALAIMLSYPLQKEGIKKQVIFFIEKNNKPYGNRYLINTAAISINGIPIYHSDSFINSFNFYKELGF